MDPQIALFLVSDRIAQSHRQVARERSAQLARHPSPRASVVQIVTEGRSPQASLRVTGP